MTQPLRIQHTINREEFPNHKNTPGNLYLIMIVLMEIYKV